jgi:membrane protein YqaA with SNARE-associated domain
VIIHLLVVAGVVVGINLLPAFAPPTWAVLVYFRISDDLPIAALVVVGAVSAALGRYGLARAFGAFGSRLPRKRRENLEALGTTLSGTTGLLGSLVLFAASPIPSNSLFEAAGLARVRLLPLLAAFCAGRLVSYSVYLAAASRFAGSVRGVITQGFTSPQAIALGLLGLVILVVIVRIDWISVIDRTRAWVARREGKPPPPSIRERLR